RVAVSPAVEGIPRAQPREGLEKPLQGRRESLVLGGRQFTRPQLAVALAENALALAQRNGEETRVGQDREALRRRGIEQRVLLQTFQVAFEELALLSAPQRGPGDLLPQHR